MCVMLGVMLDVIFSSSYRVSMLAVTAEEDMLDVILVVRLVVMLGSGFSTSVFFGFDLRILCSV